MLKIECYVEYWPPCSNQSNPQWLAHLTLGTTFMDSVSLPKENVINQLYVHFLGSIKHQIFPTPSGCISSRGDSSCYPTTEMSSPPLPRPPRASRGTPRHVAAEGCICFAELWGSRGAGCRVPGAWCRAGEEGSQAHAPSHRIVAPVLYSKPGAALPHSSCQFLLLFCKFAFKMVFCNRTSILGCSKPSLALPLTQCVSPLL